MDYRNTEEIILIDKPKGITSYDVIRKLKYKLSLQSAECRIRIGHAGTLDPLATGLLIIGIGAGTKKLNEYLKLPKIYITEILLGIRTDTGDLEGKVLERKEILKLSDTCVKKVLKEMVGKLELPVPAYSAIKRGGEALYKKARRGEQIELPIKVMKIDRASFCDMSPESDGGYVVEVEFAVGSGTYIRSLAEEFGKRLGYPATVKELRRTSVGDFDIKDAKKLEDF